MYLQYFQLATQPFGATPDPDFMYYSDTHREALASIYCAFYANRGFTTVIAPPGMGKTTMLFHFLHQIRDFAKSVFLFNTQCESRELLRYVLRDLGIPPSNDLGETYQQLNEFLAAQARALERFVLVIDEAHDLSDVALESVRLLSNFETQRTKLMHIILAGQPQLSHRLKQDSMLQLRQRISTVCHLRPLSEKDTAAYIERRLVVSGYSGPPLFSTESLGLIARVSGGIPRNINTMCFNALTLCCALGQKRVERRMIEEVIADLQLPESETVCLDNEPADSAPTLFSSFAPAAQERRSHQFFRLAAIVGLMCLLGIFWSSSPARQVFHESATQSRPVTGSLNAIRTQLPNSIAANSFVVTAEPGMTLRALCMQYLGKFDASLSEQIQLLNPELTDLNKIQSGETIHLPGHPVAKSAPKAATQIVALRSTR